MSNQPDDIQMMILVSNVLILANQLEDRDRANGTTRFSHDYYSVASRLILSERAKVSQSLGRR